jgi:multiple sugar transport system permease protein
MAGSYTTPSEVAATHSMIRPKKIWAVQNTKYLFVLPAFLLILGITIFPLIYSLGISFTDWSIQSQEWTFVGLTNYGQVLFTDTAWQLAMVRTIAITLLAVVIELVLGFAIAHLLIDELPGKNIIIAVLIFPVVMNPIVIGFIWKVLYNPSYGPIDQILSVFAGQKLNLIWLANQNLAFWAILITEIWQWTPFMFLVILAGLLSLNPELYEAAAIDGASRWNILVQITIPLLKPIIITAVLIRALDVFKIFDLVFVMTNGGPGTATQTISHYIYLLGFKFFRLGYAAAASYLLLIFLSIVVPLLLRQFSKE